MKIKRKYKKPQINLIYQKKIIIKEKKNIFLVGVQELIINNLIQA